MSVPFDSMTEQQQALCRKLQPIYNEQLKERLVQACIADGELGGYMISKGELFPEKKATYEALKKEVFASVYDSAKAEHFANHPA